MGTGHQALRVATPPEHVVTWCCAIRAQVEGQGQGQGQEGEGTKGLMWRPSGRRGVPAGIGGLPVRGTRPRHEDVEGQRALDQPVCCGATRSGGGGGPDATSDACKAVAVHAWYVSFEACTGAGTVRVCVHMLQLLLNFRIAMDPPRTLHHH